MASVHELLMEHVRSSAEKETTLHSVVGSGEYTHHGLELTTQENSQVLLSGQVEDGRIEVMSKGDMGSKSPMTAAITLMTPMPVDTNWSLPTLPTTLASSLLPPIFRTAARTKPAKINPQRVSVAFNTTTATLIKQNPLLQQLQAKQQDNAEDLQPPKVPLSQRLKIQNVYLKDPVLGGHPLSRGRASNYAGLSLLKQKQNPLLQLLTPTAPPDPTEGLSVPGIKSEAGFELNDLQLLQKRTNPLLRILKFDHMHKRIIASGLSPPEYQQNPLFQLLVQNPTNFSTDFLRLPRRMQNNLLQILQTHGGEMFEADKMLELPKPSFVPGDTEFELPRKGRVCDTEII